MEYRTYWMRWLLIAIETSTSFTRNLSARSFAIMNNVIANYFQVAPNAVDVLGTIDTLSAVPLSLLLAFAGGRLGLRSMMLIKSACTFLSWALCTIGFLSRDLYWVIFFGRAIMGIVEALLFVVPTVLAAHWFPKHELATAFSIIIFGNKLGGGIAGVLFPFLLTKVELRPQLAMLNDSLNGNYEIKFPNSSFGDESGSLQGANLNDEFLDVELLNTTHSEESIIINSTRIKFTVSFGVVSLIMLIALILTIIFCKDHPPTPPSASQANILVTVNPMPVKSLFKIPQFWLICVSVFFRDAMRLYSILMPSFILDTFPSIDNRTPGILMLVMMICGGLFGNLVIGRLLDYLKAFKSMSIACYVGIIFSLIAVYLGHLYKDLTTVLVSYVMLFVTANSTFIAMAEYLVEVTYPHNKIIVTGICYAFLNVGVFVFTQFERWIQEISNVPWAVFSSIPLCLIGLVLLIFTRPEYKRTAIDMASEGSEQASLVTQK